MQFRQVILFVLVTMIVSCSKKLEVDAPDRLNISVNNQRSQIGDTLYFNTGDTVKFLINGNVDNIVFYSGEAGRQYSFAQRTTVSGVIPQLSFTSVTNTSLQFNTLKVLATKRVDVRDSASIVNANWTDITSRVQLAINATAVNSGIVDLSDIASDTHDSLFIAFKYTGVAGTLQRNWIISNIAVNNVLPEGHSVSLLTTASAVNYWTVLGNNGALSARWTPSTTQLQITGGAASAPNNISWIVSQPLLVGVVNPDKPVVVKHASSALPAYTVSGITYFGYNQVYTRTGLYKASFVYFNKSIDDQATAVKEYYIRVN